MSTRLVHCVLSEYDGAAEPAAQEVRPLRPKFGFEELRLLPRTREPRHTMVEVGFEFLLLPPDSSAELVEVSAVYRLLFESEGHPSDEERRTIACREAPREAWPVFRAHVDRTLAEMGLPPYHGQRLLPHLTAALAGHVLDETEEIDRELAAQAKR